MDFHMKAYHHNPDFTLLLNRKVDHRLGMMVPEAPQVHPSFRLVADYAQQMQQQQQQAPVPQEAPRPATSMAQPLPPFVQPEVQHVLNYLPQFGQSIREGAMPLNRRDDKAQRKPGSRAEGQTTQNLAESPGNLTLEGYPRMVEPVDSVNGSSGQSPQEQGKTA
jgi:hypothetical protein